MEHTRIDEGVQRKPRKSRQRAMLRRNESGLCESVPPDLDPDQVLKLYLTASTSSSVADQLGIRRSTLTAWLRNARPEQWRAVQIIRAHIKREDGDDGLYTSRNALELARAREVLRSGQWDLERLDEDYRPKQDVVVAVGDLGELLAEARARAKVIQAETVSLSPPQHGQNEPVSDVGQVVDSQ